MNIRHLITFIDRLLALPARQPGRAEGGNPWFGPTRQRR